MPLSARIDSSVYQQRMRKLLKELGITEEEFIREQGALFAMDAGKATPPHAGGELKISKRTLGSKLDFEAGRNAILSDLNIAFKVRDREYLYSIIEITGKRRNIRQTLRSKRTGRAYVVDVDYVNPDSAAEAIAWYQTRRRADGRVKGRQGGKKANDTRIGRWQARDVMWVTKDIFDAVYQHQIRNVGLAKATAGKAALQINPRTKLPLIVRKLLNKATGRGHLVKTADGPEARIDMSAGGFEHTQRQLGWIARHRLKQMELRFLRLIKPLIKESGFRVR